MKKLMLVMSLFIAAQANAADLATCKAKVISSCLLGAEDMQDIRGAVKALSESQNLRLCKEAIDSGVDNIIFRDSDDIVSVNLKSCLVNKVALAVDIKRDVVFEGRLFMATSANRVIFVGLNGRIFELKNASGEPYSSVESVKVSDDGKKLVLLRERNQKTELTLTQIENRINAKKINVISTQVN
jgi:hypothetical protein